MNSLLLLLLAFSTASAGEWTNVSNPFTGSLKPGYGGPTSGVSVDRASGAVFVVVSDLGLWRSSDQGASFARCDGQTIGGRGETGWALHPDPAGHRLACFMIYGDSGLTTDGGNTWKKWTTSHLDFGAVDWADTAQCFLAIRHESGGMLTTSADAGTTWQDLGKGFSGCGVLDHATFVATKEKEPGIFRSSDAGATWTKISDETPTAAVPVVYEKIAYWPARNGLLTSLDAGATWRSLGTAVDASYGPFFKNADHFVVVGKSGFHETTDHGTTWTKAAPLPEGFTVNRVGPHYAWDPNADIFYASMMTKPTFRWTRK